MFQTYILRERPEIFLKSFLHLHYMNVPLEMYSGL